MACQTRLITVSHKYGFILCTDALSWINPGLLPVSGLCPVQPQKGLAKAAQPALLLQLLKAVLSPRTQLFLFLLHPYKQQSKAALRVLPSKAGWQQAKIGKCAVCVTATQQSSMVGCGGTDCAALLTQQS